MTIAISVHASSTAIQCALSEMKIWTSAAHVTDQDVDIAMNV